MQDLENMKCALHVVGLLMSSALSKQRVTGVFPELASSSQTKAWAVSAKIHHR
jgi:hypothetical protein